MISSSAKQQLIKMKLSEITDILERQNEIIEFTGMPFDERMEYVINSLYEIKHVINPHNLAFILCQQNVPWIACRQYGKKLNQAPLANRGGREIKRPADDYIGIVRTMHVPMFAFDKYAS